MKRLDLDLAHKDIQKATKDLVELAQEIGESIDEGGFSEEEKEFMCKKIVVNLLNSSKMNLTTLLNTADEAKNDMIASLITQLSQSKGE